MSATEAVIKDFIGQTGLVGMDKLVQLLAHVEFAGDPTSNVVPQHVGQWCHDTTNDDWYVADALTNADWKIGVT